ncbi:hypothetical protein FLONG3_4955 [Fusarium longipes]|uniref:Uncharacterized protein n=1 Tax=Fusarium longipes TaxID=694270 RepID=A0A395SXS8_9HYPO|nr:hypothetical protein FLONG3_4955 [Fusarium longipes]
MTENPKSAFYDYAEPSASSSPPPKFGQVIQNVPSSRSHFATITRSSLDRINLINFSEVEVAEIHEIVRKSWSKGIATVYPREQSREFKLKGHPWGYDPNGCEESLLLVLRIIEALYNIGWVMYSAIEINALVFRKQYHNPPPCEWISISFHGGDKLKILNSPPSALVNDVISAFVTDIQRHEVRTERAKIKFKGFPWQSIGHDDEDETQMKLITLLEVVERNGFSLYARTTARYSDETSESNVLVFQRRLDWVSGTSIYEK